MISNYLTDEAAAKRQEALVERLVEEVLQNKALFPKEDSDYWKMPNKIRAEVERRAIVRSINRFSKKVAIPYPLDRITEGG